LSVVCPILDVVWRTKLKAPTLVKPAVFVKDKNTRTIICSKDLSHYHISEFSLITPRNVIRQ